MVDIWDRFAEAMTNLLAGKKGLVIGVANDKSIAWGIAKVLAENGASLAFTYQGDSFGKRVIPLAESLGSNLVFNVDVQHSESLDLVFSKIQNEWGSMDFLVHAVAFSEKSELSGRLINTSRDNFIKSMEISCYSLIDLSRRSSELMVKGGTIITLSDKILIACNENTIFQINMLQKAGKNKMSVKDFLNGNNLKIGEKLD